MGSEAGCSSLIYSGGGKVEIYIHIRLHCGVLHVRDTDSPGMKIRASTRGQFELPSPRGQVKVVRPLAPCAANWYSRNSETLAVSGNTHRPWLRTSARCCLRIASPISLLQQHSTTHRLLTEGAQPFSASRRLPTSGTRTRQHRQVACSPSMPVRSASLELSACLTPRQHGKGTFPLRSQCPVPRTGGVRCAAAEVGSED